MTAGDDGNRKSGSEAARRGDADPRPSDPASTTRTKTPVPIADDARYARAWRVWLEALAHDPEAAWAAALTYRSLDPSGRDAWIDALEVDLADVGAPPIALYAPLLAVEDDEARRARLEATLRRHGAPVPTQVVRGLRGAGKAGARVIVLVHPLYLEFVEVLTCQLDDHGFVEARHDPIRLAAQAPKAGDVIEGAEVEAVPVEPLIEELAHAVVATKRDRRSVPTALARFVDLFTPRPESVDRLKLR